MRGRVICRFGAELLVAASLALPLAAEPQPKAPQATVARTEILFLGTSGGPLLHASRSKPATLLIVDGRYYLIDCGMGTMQRLLEAGIDAQQIRTIFLTHLHSDHTLGLADVLANDYFLSSLKPDADAVDIYGPPQTGELVDSAFRYMAVTVRPFAAENPGGFRSAGGQLINPFRSHEFTSDGTVYQDDKIRVVASENTHYALMPPGVRKTLQSFSYRIQTPHGTVVFTGDTGPSAAVDKLAQGADVLIAEASALDDADREQFVRAMTLRNHWMPERAQKFRAHFEAEHLDADEVGQVASRAHAGAVLLYHYDPDDRPPHESFVRAVKVHFPGPVYAPDDLDRYCLSAGKVRPCRAPGRG